MSIVDKIIELMNQKKITQKQLTDFLGVDKSIFSQWKSGKNQSYMKYTSQIADFLGVQEYYLTSDDLKLNFTLHEFDEDDYVIKCPECGYDYTHFEGIKPVDFANQKSYGIALEFTCEAGHTFYLIIDSYKGNTYAVFTDENCVDYTPVRIESESSPVSLQQIWQAENITKYRTLDEYGKKAVDDLLNTEYERCTYVEEEETITLPFSLLKASAGLGDYLFDENFEEIEVKDTPLANQADFVIEVDGDSMLPRFKNGDKVFVKGQQNIDIGDIGIFIIDSCGYIKQAGDGELISLNPKYPNVELHEYSDVRCIGKVIGKV